MLFLTNKYALPLFSPYALARSAAVDLTGFSNDARDDIRLIQNNPTTNAAIQRNASANSFCYTARMRGERKIWWHNSMKRLKYC